MLPILLCAPFINTVCFVYNQQDAPLSNRFNDLRITVNICKSSSPQGLLVVTSPNCLADLFYAHFLRFNPNHVPLVSGNIFWACYNGVVPVTIGELLHPSCSRIQTSNAKLVGL